MSLLYECACCDPYMQNPPFKPPRQIAKTTDKLCPSDDATIAGLARMLVAMRAELANIKGAVQELVALMESEDTEEYDASDEEDQ